MPHHDYTEAVPTEEADDDDNEVSGALVRQRGPFRNSDEINEFRNRMRIKVKGVDVPSPAASFHDMNICSELKHIILHNIEQSQWKEPTPIQMQVIPAMLQGRDILATAPTGSGKTAAFVIPPLSKLQAPRKQGFVFYCEVERYPYSSRHSRTAASPYERTRRADIPRGTSFVYGS